MAVSSQLVEAAKEQQVPLALALGLVGLTYTLLHGRKKAQLARDGSDYKGTLSDFLNIMRNSDFEQHKAKDTKASVRVYVCVYVCFPGGSMLAPCVFLRILIQPTNHQSTDPHDTWQVDQYADLFSGARQEVGKISSDESIEGRREKYDLMVESFYDLVTDFYEYGWGQSFHFGPRWKGEGFVESVKRAEYHLCSRLGMKPGMRALDVGCGVGGPMRNMAIFSGARIDGVTINQYQVRAYGWFGLAWGHGHSRGPKSWVSPVVHASIGLFPPPLPR